VAQLKFVRQDLDCPGEQQTLVLPFYKDAMVFGQLLY